MMITESVDSVEGLRKAAVAIYGEVPTKIADELAARLNWAAHEIERLQLILAYIKAAGAL